MDILSIHQLHLWISPNVPLYYTINIVIRRIGMKTRSFQFFEFFLNHFLDDYTMYNQ